MRPGLAKRPDLPNEDDMFVDDHGWDDAGWVMIQVGMMPGDHEDSRLWMRIFFDDRC